MTLWGASPRVGLHFWVQHLQKSFHLSGQLLQDGGEHGKTLGFHDRGPLMHFSGCGVSSLVRRILCGIPRRWITHSLSPQMVVLAEALMCRKGKPINRISIYSSKDKVLSFPQRKWSNVVNLPPGCWLVLPGNSAVSGAQCWSLLLAYLALSSSCSQVSLCEAKSMLSS